MLKPLKKAGWLETAFLLIGYLTRYKVEGDSMTPTIEPGDDVAVDPNGTLAEGDIVVIRHPYIKDIVMIKRVFRIEEDERLFLSSDNPFESTDSRTFGAVSLECVKGKAVAILK